LALLAIGVTGTFLVNGHGCSSKRHQALANAQSLIDNFNQTSILTSQPNKDSTVSYAGDCVDSEPSVYAYKIFNVNANGGDIEDEINSTMSKQGFVNNNSQFMKTCYANASLKFSKASITVTVDIKTAPNSTAENDCQISSGGTIKELAFRPLTVYSVRADVRLPTN
jgi:hypothetical protein